ncbi:hypothetical protein IWX90DRAFT_125807 [Phyllosticta citrichinensis]|uniref:Uncharacterized protein n=1 Tax=Phyllosticta citrichinensis TaxID=1130410 RepID=A0ABR1Y4Y1_9PEZI
MVLSVAGWLCGLESFQPWTTNGGKWVRAEVRVILTREGQRAYGMIYPALPRSTQHIVHDSTAAVSGLMITYPCLFLIFDYKRPLSVSTVTAQPATAHTTEVVETEREWQLLCRVRTSERIYCRCSGVLASFACLEDLVNGRSVSVDDCMCWTMMLMSRKGI